MAQSRLISSDIWSDDWFGPLPFFDQALWIGLFSTCADDQGRLLDNPILIRAAVFPYKDTRIEDIEAAIAKFAEAGKVRRYQADGKHLLQIVNWWDHQRPQWAQPSRWPAPIGWQDAVRTRQNGEYVTFNWDGTRGFQVVPSGEPTTLYAQVNPQPYPLQVARQDPTPDPVPSPSPDHPDSLGGPSEGAGAPAPEPPPVAVEAPQEPAPQTAEPEPEPEPAPTPRKRATLASVADPRTNHPAIQAVRAVTLRYPPREIYDRIISEVGDEPDVGKLRLCWEKWRSLGFSKVNYDGWLFDWYKNGGPPARNGNGHAPPDEPLGFAALRRAAARGGPDG